MKLTKSKLKEIIRDEIHTLNEKFTKRDITKVEKAIKKWPWARPLDGKIEHIEPTDNGKYIKIVFSSFSDENRIKVFMTVKMGYKYVTRQRNPNRLWFKQ